MNKRHEAIRAMDLLAGRREPFLFVIDFEMDSPEVLTPSEAAGKGILYDIAGARNSPPARPPLSGRALRLRARPVAESEYRRAFDDVRAELAAGNSYLLNLTFPTPVEPDGGGDPEDFLRSVFHEGPAMYRLYYPGRFVCFSPESFVRIRGDVISSRPMKGTIGSDVPGAAEVLLSDPKELAEHTTIVDLIRNDLSIVASSVTVERFMYLDRLSTSGGGILQASSLVTGRLEDGWRERLGETIFSLLPAGSVTGAPKKKTVEIIRRTEGRPRGFYTGIAGYYDGTDLDSCVLIRYIETTGGKLYYRSGGGITMRSEPRAEYEEMIRKVYVPAV